MAPAAIEEVFDLHRLPDGFHFIFFLLYLPLGTFLCILRLLFCVQIGIFLLILPKGSLLRRIILRIHGTILGIIIFVEDGESSSPGSKILVSNSISQLDSLIFESVDNHVLVAKCQQLPSFVHWLMGYPDFSSDAGNQISNEFRNYCSQTEAKGSVLVFPEESTTNGKMALLKFSSWQFDTSLTYQPVVLSAKRFTVLPIKLSVMDANFWGDFLWMMFVPFTVFNVRYLPEMQKEESASAEDFAKSVNMKMVEALGFQSSLFDVGDKNEFIKRLKRDSEERSRPAMPFASPPQQQQQQEQQQQQQQQQQRLRQQSTPTSKSDRMVQQVKDVFPQVPIDVIRKDILKSKSVDATLANILEGKVKYTLLTSEEVEKEKRKEKEMKVEAEKPQVKKQANLSDKTKGLTFQEKKKLMLDEARRRYLEKHPEFCQ